MTHCVGLGPLQVGHGQLVEVLFGLQRAKPCVIDIEKRLEILEVASRAERLNRRVGQFHAVAGRQAEHELRLKSAFQVNVQLRLGQTGNESAQVHHAARLSLIGEIGVQEGLHGVND